MKTAIQRWFNDKVEQVLGLGRAVWNLLTRGGINLAQIGRMAWAGIKQAIPPALIAILVEKLASLIVPAAGAVLIVIQGLQAAWGTVSRILQAIDRFITFLRAVKSGNAGPSFAQAVAAAAVTVMDFVSNFLLARLARGASRIAGRIRTIAQRIGAALARTGRRLGARIRGLVGGARRRLRAIRDRFRNGRSHPRRRDRRRSTDRRQRLIDHLNRAVNTIRPRLDILLRRGTNLVFLWARLRWLQMRWRLRSLGFEGDVIMAQVNPKKPVKETRKTRLGAALEALLDQVEHRFFQELANRRTPETRRAVRLAERRLRRQKKVKNRADLSNLNLPESERALLTRRIRGRHGNPVEVANGIFIRYGPGQAMQVFDTTNMARYHVKSIPLRPTSGRIVDGRRVLLPRGSEYSVMLRSLLALARELVSASPRPLRWCERDP